MLRKKTKQKKNKTDEHGAAILLFELKRKGLRPMPL